MDKLTEVCRAIESCGEFVIEVRDIPYGKHIVASDGLIIDCYDSGKIVPRGKNIRKAQAILSGNHPRGSSGVY